MDTVIAKSREGKMRLAYFWMRMADEPFYVLLALLSFLLRKDLGASAFQISLLAATRPMVSLFSFYWGAGLMRKKTKLLPNLMTGWVLGRLPFLFVPVFQNVWFLIFCVANYQFFYRASTPALMEMMKLTMTRPNRDKLFSLAMIISFVEGALLGIVLAWMFDANPIVWKLLFAPAAILSLSAFLLQRRIDLPEVVDEELPRKNNKIIQPWIDSAQLLRRRPDFARFQWGFMFGGVSIMMMTAPLAFFCHDVLHVSSSSYTHARTIFMAVGVALSTFFWKKLLSAISMNRITAMVLLVFATYASIMLLAQVHQAFLFSAFLVYGIAQSGSQLLWNLSGPYFAGNEDSSQYTVVNVLTVGIRGIVAPFAGGALCSAFGPSVAIAVSLGVCLFGVGFMLFERKKLRGVEVN